MTDPGSDSRRSLWEIGKDQRSISFSLPKEGEYSEFLSSSDDEDTDVVSNQLASTTLVTEPKPEVHTPSTPAVEVTLSSQGQPPLLSARE